MPQPSRATVALALAVAALTLTALAPPAAADTTAPTPAPPREGTNSQITSFYFGKSYLITPVPPYNETRSQTVDALGVSLPRLLISNVGTWQVTLSEEGMVIDSLEGLSIWASSDQGAKDARFIVNVLVNGNSAGQLNTETKAVLSSSPEEFRINPGNSRLTQTTFPKGSQLSFQLQYAAGSTGPIGPSAGSTFHYYGNVHRSRIDFVTNPFNLTLADLKIEGHHLNITEIVRDAFSVDPGQKIYSVSFSGPSSSQERFVRHIDTRVDPLNGTTLVWDWNFGGQGGVTAGAYSITLSARYIGSDYNYTNVSSADIDFPLVTHVGDGGFGGGGTLLIAGAAVAAGAGAFVGFRVVRARRARSP